MNTIPAFGVGTFRLQGQAAVDSVRNALDVGYRAPLRSTLELHVYTGVGVQYYLTDPYTDVVADLEGAPTGASSMRVPVSLGQSEVIGVVGLELMTGKTWSLGVQYNMGFADHSDTDSFACF